jgi:hypothetical protein
MGAPNMEMEKETYTLFKHVIGKDYQPYTAVDQIEVKVHREASLSDMMQAFRSFLLAIGYSDKGISEYITPE